MQLNIFVSKVRHCVRFVKFSFSFLASLCVRRAVA
jgi:hypothetical protein